MKLSKKILYIVLSFASLFLLKSYALGAEYDFYITQDTILHYVTGNDYVDVEIMFNREIENSSYYFSAQGEQIFHIPDPIGKEDSEVLEQREFKKDSIRVTNRGGDSIEYSVEELDIGEGMYVKVPNYTETKHGYNYTVYVNYNVHEYVTNSGGLIKIEYPALSEDTKLEQVDQSSGTKTKITYNLDIIVDENIPELAKISPQKYQKSDQGEMIVYSFDSQSRIDHPILLEFGTSLIYRFKISLLTEKTDNIIPEKYSQNVQTISTNIYEMAIPRDFGETNQRVKIEEINPTPKKIVMDNEGNVIATFEVPANKDGEIHVSGYIWLEQPSLEEGFKIPDISYQEYKEEINSDLNLSKYLQSGSFWQVNDSYIKSEAAKLLEEKESVEEIIRADYTYIGEALTYDDSMIDNLAENRRKGAKDALDSGIGVCMEYADSLTAILRAQGIPSRIAFGYSSSGEDSYAEAGHSWVQAWIPEYGWLSIDPTYEGENMKIGPNIDLILLSTQYNDEDRRLKIFSADSFSQESDNLKIQVYPITEESITNETNLLSYSEIQFESDEYSTREMVNMVVKTTPIGKALIIILPISITIFLVILLLSLTVSLIKRLRTDKASPNQQP